MTILDELRKGRGLYAQCPNCDEEFRLSEAKLFDAAGPLPSEAQNLLDERRGELKDRREDLKRRKKQAEQRAGTAGRSVNIGKVVEKIAPSLRGFPGPAADYRSLFEPIDYLVFKGLSSKGEVEALTFIDVKSGKARLAGPQPQIRKAVEAGKVGLAILGPLGEGAR